MTSNERKIIKCLWEAKGKAHIQAIARQTGFSQDFARILGRSLERSGYIKFADMNSCHLLTKGRTRFQDNAPVLDNASEVVAASVAAAPAISVGDAIAEDNAPTKEAEDLPRATPTATDDSDLDKALAEVGVSYPFQKDEEASEKNEEIAEAETGPQNIEEPSSTASSEPTASGGETIGVEPQVMAEAEPKEPEVFQATEPVAVASIETPQVVEEKIADNPVLTASSSESPEKVAPKEESAKPSNSGWSFKKIVHWFAEKK